jgi:hypothetical protein
LVNGIGNVVLQSRQIGEAEIEHLDSVLLHELEDGFRISHGAPLQFFRLPSLRENNHQDLAGSRTPATISRERRPDVSLIRRGLCKEI